MRNPTRFLTIVVLLPGMVIITDSCKKNQVPTLTTSEVTNITATTATSGGTINDEGSAIVFERGVCWSKETNPSIADDRTKEEGGASTFISNMSGLAASTAYYARAYATNKSGTGYGNEISFQTAPSRINFSEWITYDSIADQEGNIYRTVKIGEQSWMAENLRATTYQDGSPIPIVPDLNSWIIHYSGAYCFYNNNLFNKSVYGAIYNWYAVADQRKICPAGWHVPTDAEWNILTDFLGGNNIAGMKIKEVGLAHWVSPNSGASNLSGFTALPGGSRYSDLYDNFSGMGYYGKWWSSTEDDSNKESAWYRSLNTFNIIIERKNYWKVTGYSVRCMMD